MLFAVQIGCKIFLFDDQSTNIWSSPPSNHTTPFSLVSELVTWPIFAVYWRIEVWSNYELRKETQLESLAVSMTQNCWVQQLFHISSYSHCQIVAKGRRPERRTSSKPCQQGALCHATRHGSTNMFFEKYHLKMGKKNVTVSLEGIQSLSALSSDKFPSEPTEQKTTEATTSCWAAGSQLAPVLSQPQLPLFPQKNLTERPGVFLFLPEQTHHTTTQHTTPHHTHNTHKGSNWSGRRNDNCSGSEENSFLMEFCNDGALSVDGRVVKTHLAVSIICQGFFFVCLFFRQPLGDVEIFPK